MGRNQGNMVYTEYRYKVFGGFHITPRLILHYLFFPSFPILHIFASVGFIGYPNVGKSSIINTLRSKKVCNVAPIPGETKVGNKIDMFICMILVQCPALYSGKLGQA